ncbi:hypothetical protein MCOR27_005874 [Pyricularia oryzae]|uniref:Oligopeptide transporter 2 n=1 Tax=Pyricularia grisea TaxID=148305 RepID=A0ABQ8P0V6_PYRGI|nr:hypothetical protein MCOR02_008727 [Pyricularia oryzae]KAI6304954.1 hypothetical protein MCOR33_000076 [Pyricularia grisea]KAI6256186.1 hypothetical protein MCOR19_007356 [Pyricularia oryzae]KAI6277900.1 hypothetical protein MCOR27_005874 [Pyricularia oryzae]KAI6288008.1 hypothetical protein MCOR26_000416 [Pyricularia oryzae]
MTEPKKANEAMPPEMVDLTPSDSVLSPSATRVETGTEEKHATVRTTRTLTGNTAAMSPSTTRDEPVAFEEIAAAPTTVESPQREDIEEIVEKMRDGAAGITPEMRAKVEAYYGRKAEEENLAPSADVVYILDKIALMSEEQAMEILVKAIDFHSIDPNFPGATMAKIKMLVQGQKASGLDPADYDFDLKTEAAIIHYHSPYPEVRSVTMPGDDPNTPCETFRAYFLGLIFTAGCTAINTFFSPRQPSIEIKAQVMQLLLAPCGKFMAKVSPDWGFTLRGTRYTLNPGPWTYKEQVLATIMFTIANNVGNVYYVYLVQRMPQYLGNTWVTFSYEIVLALATQFFGLGFAGLLRRFVVYPVTAIFPKVFPALALNRALVLPEKKGEVINGWKASRYRFFLTAFVLMFFYFWIPNYLFKAVRSFNWMTWIAPENFTLGMITGFWGGMGFNPLPTFDYNVAGSSILVTPWFSAIQQYSMRILSGLIIIGMYWGNMYWSAYMPINSNEAFDNTGVKYNVTRILNDDRTSINLDKYQEYGPPFFSGANVFGQGAWFAWYPMTLFSVTIQYWDSIKRSGIDMWKGIPHRKSIYESYDDPHTRLMSVYPEVPDWWFLAVLLTSLALGIIALQVWPVSLPVWSLFAVVGISAIMLVPSVLIMASANVTMGFNVLFQLLGGIWFVGNPEALILVVAFGQNFDAQAHDYMSDQKMGHYAKVPPRAVFRAQMIAVFINCFIFVGMLDWMVLNYNDGTLCQWNNAQHFVCTNAVLVYASSIVYGAFGVRNMFELYPVLPYCFLIGALVGIVWGVGRRFGGRLRSYLQRSSSERHFHSLDRWVLGPASHLYWFDPAVAWAGALNWTGGNNLSYATVGIYLSFFFMYHVKRHYGAWWEKYNYLLEAGFGVGIAISATIQTFGLVMTRTELPWWGNTVTMAGVDYRAYNQNATLLPLPEAGFFGPTSDQYPMRFS